MSDPVQPDQFQDGALCTLEDVARRVPGYDPGDEGEIDATLSDFIVGESADFIEETGREIIPKNADTFRIFDLTLANCRRRQLPIGDVAAIGSIELLDYDGTTSLGVIAAGLYVLLPRARLAWEPYRRLTFPYRPGSPLLVAPGRTLKITATFGFPEIPGTVRRAVATLTIWRYLNDIASVGTSFAEIANQPDINIAAGIRAALDVRDRLKLPGFA